MPRDLGPLGVERATRAELRALGVSVQTNALAATMVSLAQQIDYAKGAASAAMAAAQLRETRRVLMDEASEHAAGDEIDEVNAQRAKHVEIIDLEPHAVTTRRRSKAQDLDGSSGGPVRGRARKADS